MQVWIKESREFRNFVDRMFASANTSLVVGTSSWKQQFVEAVTVEGAGALPRLVRALQPQTCPQVPTIKRCR